MTFKILFKCPKNYHNTLRTCINFQLFGTGFQFGQPRVGLTDKDSGAKCHAPLSSCAKSSSYKLVQCVWLICISHNNPVVFSSHVALNSFPISTSSFINILSLYIKKKKLLNNKWNITDKYYLKTIYGMPGNIINYYAKWIVSYIYEIFVFILPARKTNMYSCILLILFGLIVVVYFYILRTFYKFML